METLGSGAFKKTVKGIWQGQQVAIQIHTFYDPARLPREAQALRSVNSPHVAKLLHETAFDYKDRTVPVYICEFIRGRTLARVVAEGPIQFSRLIPLAIGITRGLLAIHEQKLVHRDIKPQNVMVEETGRAVVLDLGIAKHLDKSTVTFGFNPGTVGWMAPEQCGTDIPVDHRCDLFALALVIAYCATGHHPFGPGDPETLQQHILTQDPTRIPEHPSAFQELLTRLMEKKPYRRPRRSRDVLEALEAL
ncbi:MAG: serine/threonine-protein kinase [Dehalococcoidia bacterium]